MPLDNETLRAVVQAEGTLGKELLAILDAAEGSNYRYRMDRIRIAAEHANHAWGKERVLKHELLSVIEDILLILDMKENPVCICYQMRQGFTCPFCRARDAIAKAKGEP